MRLVGTGSGECEVAVQLCCWRIRRAAEWLVMRGVIVE